MSVAPEQVKACCASAYGSAAARYLLGDSFHPGGRRLTSKLIRALSVGPCDTVLDVACGPGVSALQLARETGCRVVGVDLSTENVAAADRAAAQAGLGGRVSFVCGDAESLPLADASVDGVLCECALCTFPDKARAARELARVLRARARLALSDVTVTGPLPSALTGLEPWIACIADARSHSELIALLDDVGMVVELVESHDAALARLLDRVDARLRAARMLAPAVVPPAEVERGLELVAAARRAITRGVLGYAEVLAHR